MRFYAPVGVPIVATLVSLVLGLLAILAGKSPGFMEEYNIVMLNTSELGKNLIPTATTGGSSPSSTANNCDLPGILGKACSSATAAVASAIATATSGLDKLEDDLADKLAAKLGIHQFYSLHILDTCEGSFSPNATAPNAGYNVTNCTEPLQTGQFNLTALFDHELSVGPLKLNLASLGFTKDLQNELDKIPKLLLAMAIVYFIAVGFTGLSFIASLSALFLLPNRARRIALINVALAILAVLAWLTGNLITTAGAKPVAEKIDSFGDDFGLRASVGGKFLALTWTSFALMFITMIFWVWEFQQAKKRRGGGFSEKYDRRQSSEAYRQPAYNGRY